MWTCFYFSWNIPRGGNTGSNGNSYIELFEELAGCFQSSCIISHPHQQGMSVLISPHPCQHLYCLRLFDYSHTRGYKVNFIEVLIRISLITNDAEHLFMCLLAIVYLEKCIFRSFVCFWLDCLIIKRSLYIVYNSPLSGMICSYFSQLFRLSFHLLNSVL